VALERAGASALALTSDEERHVTTALKGIAHAYGGYVPLARAMGIQVRALYKAAGRRRPSAMLAIRLAQAAGTSVDAVLAGRLTDDRACAMCGAHGGDQ
jgi:hypothetical protein